MKSTSSYVAAWNFIEKGTSSQLFSYDFNKMFQNSCPEEHLQTAAFEGMIVTPNRKIGNDFYLIIY